MKSRRPSSTLDSIQQLERDRENRRQVAAHRRASKAAEEKSNADAGLVGDVDFMRAIRAFRMEREGDAREHSLPGDTKVCVCVRKRPINGKELRRNDHDIVTCFNPMVVVHNCKLRVDGITKYLDNQAFQFDHAFSEGSSTEEVYFHIAQPLVKFICTGGRATCFAYGQTGSGKTHTMVGIQEMAIRDLFAEMEARPDLNDVDIFVSFFEIYGNRCQDLLNNRHRLNVREDGKGEVHVAGLQEFSVQTSEELLDLVEEGNRLRTTQATETNDTSSRSHAICQVTLRRGNGRLLGKLSLVDLAGSERGQDTKSHNRQLRTESAEINKSLLALKECIRSIASGNVHVPFRASKLTMVLRDSFVRKHTRVAMVVTVSPCSTSADHTINTLRYADRVKENAVGEAAQEPVCRPYDERQRPASAPAQPRKQNAGPSPIRDRSRPSMGSDQRMSPNEHSQFRNVLTKPRDSPAKIGHIEDRRKGSQPTPTAIRLDPERRHMPAPPMPVEEPLLREDKEDELDEMDESITLGDHETDMLYLQKSLGRGEGNDFGALHKTVDSLFEEEEALLNLHMNVIQENAELLTEEGRLLQSIQGDDVVDYDIDAYAGRLQEILDRKAEIITILQQKLSSFRSRLVDEEQASLKAHIPQY